MKTCKPWARGLEPLPPGTLVQYVNPYSKTYYFRRHDDSGEHDCDPPRGFKPRKGYRLAKGETA